MLWLLKRTISMRQFFFSTKTYVKTDRYENIYNVTLKSFAYLDQCYPHTYVERSDSVDRVLDWG